MTVQDSTPKLTCRGRRSDGGRCRSTVLLPNGYCFLHSPERQAAARAARVKGGQHSATVVRSQRLLPPRLAPIFDLLERSILDCRDGKLDTKRATALASLARAAVAVLSAGMMEERLAAIEEFMARQHHERRGTP